MAQSTKSDQDMWMLYANKIKEQFLQGQNLGSENRFFIPPLNTAGIMAGPTTSQSITNYGLAIAGDSLITASNPIFVTSGDVYSKQVLNYLQNVQLQNNVDFGLKQVYDQRYAAFTTADDKYWTTYDKAQERYTKVSDPNKGDFNVWATNSYPQLRAASDARDAAQGSLDQIQSQIQGPGWAGLSANIDAVRKATDYSTSYPPYNMEVDNSMVGAQAATGAVPAVKPKQYRPSYTFGSNNTYPLIMDQWVQKGSQPGAALNKIEFNLGESSNYSWKNLGFENISASGSVGFLPFFSVSYGFNQTTQHETVSLQSSSSSIKFTISAGGIQAFDVQPDSSWNPGNVKKMYPRLYANANKDLLQSMVQVKKIIIGYNVSVTIQLDAGTYNAIKQTYNKAQSQGGDASASLFGFRLNLGGSARYSSNESTDSNNVTWSESNHTIKFPGANNTVPILMGVVGSVI